MYEDVREIYLAKGFGGRVGFGERPALVVIDMARSWLDPASPQGSAHVERVFDGLLPVLACCRQGGVPVVFTTMAFDPDGEEARGPVGAKLPHLSAHRSLDRSSGATELDPRLDRQRGEILIEKQRASAFWGTAFLSFLVARRIDTLIIVGCSTSGCIRSTAEGAHNEGFRTIVVADAVGDRSPTAHHCNLIDIDMRFADVMPSSEVIRHLGSRGARAAA